MIFDIRGRACGKTHDLVERFKHDPHAVILCANARMSDWLCLRYPNAKCQFLPWESRSLLRGLHATVAIDNVDLILAQETHHRVDTVTATP